MKREPENDIQDVLDQLATLAPGEADSPLPATQAFARISNQLNAQQRNPVSDLLRSIRDMSNRKSLMAAGSFAVLALVLLIAFPSVRAAASDFLGLFRVETFTPISVSPQQIAMLEQLDTEGMNPGEFVMENEPGEPQQVGSLTEAGALTGYTVRTLADTAGEPQVFVMPEVSGYMTVNLAGARAIVEATGIDPMLLPDSLDGARIDMTAFPSVQQVWADGTVLVQTASPYVNYPADVDPAVMGEALLRILGMDADAARQMAQTIDWTSTMLLPIPQEFATYQQVTVDGVPGVAIIPVDGSSEAALMWQKGGTVYVLSGPAGVDRLVDFANFLQ